MSRGLRFGLVLLAALTLAVGALWFARAFERVDGWHDLPPRGEPTYNPLYALKRALQADGVRAVARQRLQVDTVPLAPRDTVVLFGDPRTLTSHEADTLLAWVERGGHLVVRVPAFGGDADANAVDTPLRGELTDRLPLERVLRRAGCTSLRDPDGRPHPEFCRGARFVPAPAADVRARIGNADDGYVFARLAHGRGSVDVLGTNDFLDNGSLAEPTHAVLARQVLAPNYRAGTVHLVYAATMPPLWRWLLDRAWMAIVPLVLVLLGALWMRMQRFGPWQPSPEPARRSLVEHVQAAGEHLHRYGRGVRLQTALRDDVLARLRRRDPLAAALAGPAQAQAIAARTGLPPATASATLDTRAAEDAADFQRRIGRLITLRKRL